MLFFPRVSQLWYAAHWQPYSTLHGCAISHSWVFPQHCKNKRKINSKVWQLWHFVYSWRIYEQAPPCHKPDLNVPHIETPSRQASLFTERLSFQFGLWTPARLTSSSVTMAGASQVAGSAMMTTTVGTWAMRTSGISVVSEGRLLSGPRKVSRSQESLAVPGKFRGPRKVRLDFRGWSIQLHAIFCCLTSSLTCAKWLGAHFHPHWAREILSFVGHLVPLFLSNNRFRSYSFPSNSSRSSQFLLLLSEALSQRIMECE